MLVCRKSEMFCYDTVAERITSLKALLNYIAMERHTALPFISISIHVAPRYMGFTDGRLK